MRKYILAFLFTACWSAVSHAGTRGVPTTNTGEALQNVDYGGVQYATSSFSTAFSTVTFSSLTVTGSYVVYGVVYTTGSCGDYVDIWDFNNAATAHAQASTHRNYNVSGSTTGAAAGGSALGGVCSGQSVLTWPLRFRKGLLWRPSSAGYNQILLLYRRDGDE